MNEYFKEQLDNGATDNFFYGTEHNGEVRIKRHKFKISKIKSGQMNIGPNPIQINFCLHS